MTQANPPPKPAPSFGQRFRQVRAAAGAAAVIAALLAALAIGFAGFGVHEQMFDLDYAVRQLALGWAPKLAILGAGLGVLVFLAAIAVPPRSGRATALFAVAVAALAYAASARIGAVSAANPPLHDVATDWADPLLFGPTAVAARGPDANRIDADPKVQPQPYNPELTGARIAEVNARTCSQAVPVVITGSAAAAYEKALAAVKAQGMAIVTENPAGGRIEATAVTRYLKLKSDVLVRVKPEGAGARIDIRSVSRIGVADLGENCRIVGRLRAALSL